MNSLGLQNLYYERETLHILRNARQHYKIGHKCHKTQFILHFTSFQQFCIFRVFRKTDTGLCT